MDIYDQEAPSVNISDRLRQLREERELSIRGLGRLSGLSANALSVIERGLSSPSVSTLYKIATALEIPVTAFFEEVHPKQDVVVIKASERNRIPLYRGLWEGLGGSQYEGAVEPFMITLEAGSSSGRQRTAYQARRQGPAPAGARPLCPHFPPRGAARSFP